MQRVSFLITNLNVRSVETLKWVLNNCDKSTLIKDCFYIRICSVEPASKYRLTLCDLFQKSCLVRRVKMDVFVTGDIRQKWQHRFIRCL